MYFLTKPAKIDAPAYWIAEFLGFEGIKLDVPRVQSDRRRKSPGHTRHLRVRPRILSIWLAGYEGDGISPKFRIASSRSEEVAKTSLETDRVVYGEPPDGLIPDAEGRRRVRRLSPYEDYSREEVHDIFAPDTPFARQRGAWGVHGIVSLPDRPGDYVFFVTLGQRQGEHAFDEGIIEGGVLTWQSQPRQGLDDHHVRRLVGHDELRNSIYLFLRPRMRGNYTYLGRLKYLSHDAEREHPVYFQWQIIDWDPPEELLGRVVSAPQPSNGPSGARPAPIAEGELRQASPPSGGSRRGTGTRSFRGRKKADRSDTDKRNRQLGMAGELLVVRHERKLLTEGGRHDLAGRVRHVSLVEGDGAGYDVGSFTLGGEPKYIEVKTTRGPAETPFFVTANEVAFSEVHPDQYFLYRVYHYDDDRNAGTYYAEAGGLSRRFGLTPTQFRAAPRSKRGED